MGSGASVKLTSSSSSSSSLSSSVSETIGISVGMAVGDVDGVTLGADCVIVPRACAGAVIGVLCSSSTLGAGWLVVFIAFDDSVVSVL